MENPRASANAQGSIQGVVVTPDNTLKPELIKEYVALVHARAAGLEGKLVLASYGENPETGQSISARNLHFEIGDVDGMTEAAFALGNHQHRNIYIPLAVMRADLKRAAKGSEADIEAVLGLVADFDDPDAARYAKRMPVDPALVMETSPGRYQALVLFDTPQKPADAKQLAIGLKQAAACDHGTADLSHVWRVPGTLNWPNKKKVAEGRSPQPQPVKIAEPWMGVFTRPSDFPSQPTLEAKSPDKKPTKDDDKSAAIWTLETDLQALITKGVPVGERSDQFYHVVGWLKDKGLSREKITSLLEAHPNGIAEKYKGRVGAQVDACFSQIENNTPPLSNASRHGVKLYTIDEIANRPPPEFLVDGLFPLKGVAIVAGASGHMKSFAMITIGMSVASGTPLGGRNVKKGDVVYMLNEGQNGFSYRVRACREFYDMGSVNGFRVAECTPNLMDPKSLEPFVEAIQAADVSPRLIVIDTFSKATYGGEENSAKDMSMAISNAYAIADNFDCLVVLVDHIGKDEARGMRGSSAKYANVDAVCMVKKQSLPLKTTVQMTVAKMKDGEDGKKVQFDMRLVSVAGERVPALEAQLGEGEKLGQRDWIRLKIASDGSASRDALQSEFLLEYPESSASSFRNHISALKKAGDISEDANGYTCDAAF